MNADDQSALLKAKAAVAAAVKRRFGSGSGNRRVPLSPQPATGPSPLPHPLAAGLTANTEVDVTDLAVDPPTSCASPAATTEAPAPSPPVVHPSWTSLHLHLGQPPAPLTRPSSVRNLMPRCAEQQEQVPTALLNEVWACPPSSFGAGAAPSGSCGDGNDADAPPGRPDDGPSLLPRFELSMGDFIVTEEAMAAANWSLLRKRTTTANLDSSQPLTHQPSEAMSSLGAVEGDLVISALPPPRHPPCLQPPAAQAPLAPAPGTQRAAGQSPQEQQYDPSAQRRPQQQQPGMATAPEQITSEGQGSEGQGVSSTEGGQGADMDADRHVGTLGDPLSAARIKAGLDGADAASTADISSGEHRPKPVRAGSFQVRPAAPAANSGAVNRYSRLILSSASFKCTTMYDIHDSLLLSKLTARPGGGDGRGDDNGDEGPVREQPSPVANPAAGQMPDAAPTTLITALESVDGPRDSCSGEVAAPASCDSGEMMHPCATAAAAADVSFLQGPDCASPPSIINAPARPQQQRCASFPARRLPDSPQAGAGAGAGAGPAGYNGIPWGSALEAMAEGVVPRPAYYAPRVSEVATGDGAAGQAAAPSAASASAPRLPASDLVERSGPTPTSTSMRRWVAPLRSRGDLPTLPVTAMSARSPSPAAVSTPDGEIAAARRPASRFSLDDSRATAAASGGQQRIQLLPACPSPSPSPAPSDSGSATHPALGAIRGLPPRPWSGDLKARTAAVAPHPHPRQLPCKSCTFSGGVAGTALPPFFGCAVEAATTQPGSAPTSTLHATHMNDRPDCTRGAALLGRAHRRGGGSAGSPSSGMAMSWDGTASAFEAELQGVLHGCGQAPWSGSLHPPGSSRGTCDGSIECKPKNGGSAGRAKSGAGGSSGGGSGSGGSDGSAPGRTGGKSQLAKLWKALVGRRQSKSGSQGRGEVEGGAMARGGMNPPADAQLRNPSSCQNVPQPSLSRGGEMAPSRREQLESIAPLAATVLRG